MSNKVTMGIYTLPSTIEKILCIVLFGVFIGIFTSLHYNMSHTQIQFHEMKGYKDALLVQFMHLPELVVNNSKGEPQNFIFDADKLTTALLYASKDAPDYDIGYVRYHIHIFDTQTGKQWDFKNHIPLDASFDITPEEENFMVWKYANIKYPDETISAVLVRAVYIVGSEAEDRDKLKEGIVCTATEDCAEGLFCDDGNNGGAGQKYKTCQDEEICTYNKNAGDGATSACECTSQEISGGVCSVGGAPLRFIRGQPCTVNGHCQSGICNNNPANPSEYHTCT